MGIFSNAPKNSEQQKQEIDALLMQGEVVDEVYGLVLDYAAVTDKRVIFVEKEATSSELVITSEPYKRINAIHQAKGGFMKFTKKVYVTVGSKSHKMSFLVAEHAREFHDKVLERILS